MLSRETKGDVTLKYGWFGRVWNSHRSKFGGRLSNIPRNFRKPELIQFILELTQISAHSPNVNIFAKNLRNGVVQHKKNLLDKI